MDYMRRLKMAAETGHIERVVIEGGQTQGRLLFQPPPPKPKGKTIMSGLGYANEAKLKEQMEELEIDRDEKREGKLELVEDLTSVGTLPNLADFDGEKCTQVYDNYNFETRSEKRLLIHDYKQEILEQIVANQVVIIKGVTGCGKTTQVPQFILDDHRQQGIHCNIIVTQPRRIAAVSVARRVAQERGWSLGSIVGYQIGLDKVMSPDTRLAYVTTGVLLQILIKQQNLSEYTHIIIDEVHERDSETDFLLIVVRKFLKKQNCRTKVILMSATIEDAPFVDYFSRQNVRGITSQPPVIELVNQHKYRVQLYYMEQLASIIPPTAVPDIQNENLMIEKDMYGLARHLIEMFEVIDRQEHEVEFRGSVLVFLPGIAEIESLYEVLVKEPPKSGESWWICPLHSSITHEEQQQVFKPPPPGKRKIILSTNIAESSITVIDVKYVLDFCLTKHQVIDPETGYSSLELAWISKSQGVQRAGRVGRVMPGRVYRFLKRDDYQMLPEHCPPEITRCALDILVLKAKQLNVGPPEEILGLAIDPPDLTNIHKTILYLKQTGALLLTANGQYQDNDGDLTYLGHVMAALPLDTQLSRVIIFGHVFSLLPEAIIMACALSMKSIFSSPFKLQLEAYNSKLSWADCSSSDPIAYLNAYTLWKFKTKQGFFQRSGGLKENEWCRKMFIQPRVVKEVSRLVDEVTARLRHIGIESPVGDSIVKWDEVEKPLILKLILAGAFYPNYFVPQGSDEQEAVKLLSGHDPYSTVYLMGMPVNQPGNLYVHAIKDRFKHCGADMQVFFEGSSKVFISFGNNRTEENSDAKPILMPGKINLAVYRAVKMRQLGIPIEIPVLRPEEANKLADKFFPERHVPLLMRTQRLRKTSALPSIATNTLSVKITHIEDPSNFWVSISDEVLERKTQWIFISLNGKKNGEEFPPFPEPKENVGQLCIAPFAEDGKLYRAQILRVTDAHTVRVLFIDYGNEGLVGVRDLRSFPESLRALKEEPPLAIKASLAEIGAAEDRSAQGKWPKEAIQAFKKFFIQQHGIARVYSAVNNKLNLILFDIPAMRQLRGDLPMDKSFNHWLIKEGYAAAVDEPYLSRGDNMKRVAAEVNPESVGHSDCFISDCFEPAFEDFPPVSPRECRSKVKLRGPRSPLESTMYSLPKKCEGKEISIEWHSVNSVLLDAYPTDTHTRLIVAASVSQSATNKLTLRNTTVMPNIHGLASLVCMLFAPRVELRADPERRALIGALCGLGFDPDTSVSFFPENDIEITFDTQITLEDMITINKIRYWMDSLLGSVEGMNTISRVDSIEAQSTIKKHLMNLLHTRRPSRIPTSFPNPFEWDQLLPDEILDPQLPVYKNNQKSIFPFILGIDLPGKGKVDMTLLKQIELLEKYATGDAVMRDGAQCCLCQCYIKSLPELRIHVSANQHRQKVQDFRNSFQPDQN